MKPLNQAVKKENGFTLIEMSLVLFIISALLLLFIPNLANRQKTADATGTAAVQTVLQSQADLYLIEEKVPAADFGDMEAKNYLTASQLKDAEARFSIDASGTVTEKIDATP